MQDGVTFGQVLEAADQLAIDDQQALLEILSRRLIEQRRELLAREVLAAEQEFREGTCEPTTPGDIIAAITA